MSLDSVAVKYEEVYLTHTRAWPRFARDWAATSGSTTPSAAIRTWGTGHPMRCTLTVTHGPWQREAEGPQGRRTLIGLSSNRVHFCGTGVGGWRLLRCLPSPVSRPLLHSEVKPCRW